jgi:hypothetical protein
MRIMEWAKKHLPKVRIAAAIINRDEATIRELVDMLAATDDGVSGFLAWLAYTGDHLEALAEAICFACKRIERRIVPTDREG